MDPRDQYGNPVRRTDEYGNPVSHTTEGQGTMGSYGTQAAGAAASLGLGGFDNTTGHGAHHAAGTAGTTGAIAGAPAGYEHGHQQQQEHRGHKLSTTGMLHRSGSSSSSSSSSEDDGHGGRRKKGLKEKIKDKLAAGPCGGSKDTHGHGHGHVTSTTTTTADHQGYYGGEIGSGQQQHPVHHDHDKKGIMEKIKDKLPGTHGANH